MKTIAKIDQILTKKYDKPTFTGYILSDHRFVEEKLTEYISCAAAARRPRGRRTGNMMREHRISLGKTNIPRGEIRVKATSFHTTIRCTILREHDKPEVTGYIFTSGQQTLI